MHINTYLEGFCNIDSAEKQKVKNIFSSLRETRKSMSRLYKKSSIVNSTVKNDNCNSLHEQTVHRIKQKTTIAPETTSTPTLFKKYQNQFNDSVISKMANNKHLKKANCTVSNNDHFYEDHSKGNVERAENSHFFKKSESNRTLKSKIHHVGTHRPMVKTKIMSIIQEKEAALSRYDNFQTNSHLDGGYRQTIVTINQRNSADSRRSYRVQEKQQKVFIRHRASSRGSHYNRNRAKSGQSSRLTQQSFQYRTLEAERQTTSFEKTSKMLNKKFKDVISKRSHSTIDGGLNPSRNCNYRSSGSNCCTGGGYYSHRSHPNITTPDYSFFSQKKQKDCAEVAGKKSLIKNPESGTSGGRSMIPEYVKNIMKPCKITGIELQNRPLTANMPQKIDVGLKSHGFRFKDQKKQVNDSRQFNLRRAHKQSKTAQVGQRETGTVQKDYFEPWSDNHEDLVGLFSAGRDMIVQQVHGSHGHCF